MSQIPATELELVQRVCNYIEAHIDRAPTLAEIGTHFHMSHFHLQRIFKRVLGITPRQYADGCRLESFKSLVRDGHSVTTALYDAGYGSSSRLYERAPDLLGMTPLTYSKGGAGMKIAYLICNCKLGRLLVGKTGRGVCAVHLRQSDDELRAMLHREYPLAEIHETDEMCGWVHDILAHIDGSRPHLNLPLDIQATAFQLNVWQTLRAIPYGETRTYGDIAASIGKPKAARAVAEAVHSNHVAMIIPCHRAGRVDGEATAYYSPGAEESRRILREHEQDVLHSVADHQQAAD
ncbi:MAG: methylated-DNA--[protein]-cysteine S-methyltransferase [Anaerolineae bacterium]|nr:methylated-DNA--[protein]-cysteine S-methyltransferase [Anaerolineae bacterium]